MSKFLLTYRLTTHTVTGEEPCKLMFGKIIHSSLDLVWPNLRDKVINNQVKQKEYRDLHRKSWEVPEEEDWIKQFVGNQRWISRKVMQELSSTVDIVRDEQQQMCR